MTNCGKCGVNTDGGQYYRFYFGVIREGPESSPTSGEPIDEGPTFEASGSAEVFYCDRCLVQASARGELVRSAFYLLLTLFAATVAVLLGLAASPGLWVGLAALLLVAALGYAAYRRYRQLHTALGEYDEPRLREFVSANSKLQEMGELWAIAERRLTLRETGAELFLTRSEYQIWSQPGDNQGDAS